MATKNKLLTGMASTLIGGICWGFSGACGQFLFQNYTITSEWLSTTRMLSAGLLLIIIGFFKDKHKMISIWKNGKDALHLILFAVFGLMFSQYTYMTAISHSNAGTATVLQYLGPVMIMIVVCIKHKRLPSIKEALAIFLALMGTFLLATHGNIASLSLTLQGLIWGLLAALGMMLYTLLGGNIVSKYGSITATGYGMLIGGLVLGSITGSFTFSTVLDINALLALMGIILLGTLSAYSLYLTGVSLIGPVKASLIASIEPVSAAVFAFLWLGTSFTLIDILAFILILATVFLLSNKDKKQV